MPDRDESFFRKAVTLLRLGEAAPAEYIALDSEIRRHFPDMQPSIHSSQYKESISIEEKLSLCAHLTPFAGPEREKEELASLQRSLETHRETLLQITLPEQPALLGNELIDDELVLHRDHPEWDSYWHIVEQFSRDSTYLFRQMEQQRFSHVRYLANSCRPDSFSNTHISAIIQHLGEQVERYIFFHQRAYQLLHSLWGILTVAIIIDIAVILGVDLTFWIEKSSNLESASLLWGEMTAISAILLSMLLLIATYFLGRFLVHRSVQWLFVRHRN